MAAKDAKRRRENQVESSSDWATGLPEGILDMIVERLHVKDWLCFSKVCKPWKSVVVSLSDTPRNPVLHGCPWLVAKSTRDQKRLIFCSVTERKLWCRDLDLDLYGFLYGSFEDWLITSLEA
ncbi:uncharacterized protein LOC120006650 isoform X2 [Tripterygium wilfordii]|uniref:uncharacterized protein LOC120006650 isoform X2 n=1 Tax=Tripterygium wilfordii TaxID=458696 RepID=UPI0018F81F60|nr:uncharacterized protein LOC120006650 isoform X2 [Tripterygium wilfordii]